MRTALCSAVIALLTTPFSGHLLALTPETHDWHLDNGLQLIVRADDRAPIVTTQIWYRVGSVDEVTGKTGLSHFLEHMMFKGTPNYPEGEFTNTIYALGGRLNAFAAYDYTGYWQTTPANQLGTVFTLEADRMQNLSLDDEIAFENEKQVVIEERRMRIDDQPRMLTYERFMSSIFDSSPYRVMPIGWQRDLESATLEDARAWYDTWYVPNNATIVVIGDVDPDEVHQLAERTFGHIPARDLPLREPHAEIATLGEKRITVQIPATVPHLYMGFHAPVLNTADVIWEPAALTLLSSILDGGQSTRFANSLVRQQKVAASASTSYSAFYRDNYIFAISAVPAPGVSLSRLEQSILTEIENLQVALVSEQELERARKQIIAGEIYKLDSIDAQAYEIGALESVGLPWEISEEFLQELMYITPEQIQNVAQRYLNPQTMTVATLVPEMIEADPIEPVIPEALSDHATEQTNPASDDAPAIIQNVEPRGAYDYDD